MSASADDVLLRAAVCGRFDPAALLADCEEAAFVDLSGRLAAVCDEVIAQTFYGWRLRAQARREALSRLTAPATARALLSATAPFVAEDDPFADELRLHLAGRSVRKKDARDERLGAARFALAVPALAERRAAIEARVEALRQDIETEQAEVTLDYVLPRDRALLGRAGDLARLEAYALGADDSDPRPIVVSGDGGVGKSALLATLVRKLRRREGMAVISLDFDRPNLAGGDPAEIAKEFLRGLERALPRFLPHIADPTPTRKALAAVREHLISRRLVEGSPLLTESGSALLTESGRPLLVTGPDRIAEIHAEEQFSIASAQLGTLASTLAPEVLSTPLLVVADTFEIVMMRGPETVARTLDLFRFLRERFGFVRLRVILSGRALGERLAPANAPQFAQNLAPMEMWLALGGVDPRAGAAILRQLDKGFDSLPDRGQRLTAARALDGHPLALKIFHLYVCNKSPSAITTILRDLRADEGLAKETALRFLYGRILDRISDPDVQAMARPGLILRRVSPDLIRLVLAGPCGLGPIDAARASALFAQLVGNYWLIEDAGAGAARHRADLRRQMLPALLVDLPAQARVLNEGAAAYYEKGPGADDPGHERWRALDSEERDAEAIYHRALTDERPPPEFEPERARRIRDRIGEDLSLLGKPWRIVVLASAGAWREIDEAWLTPESIATLSSALRRRLIRRVTEAMISSGDSSQAQRILQLSPTGQTTPVEIVADDRGARTSRLREFGLEVRAAFNQADIAAAAAHGKSLLEPFLARSPDLSVDLEDVWLAALSVAAAGIRVSSTIVPAEADSGALAAAPDRLAISLLLSGPPDARRWPLLQLPDRPKIVDTLHFAALLSAFGDKQVNRRLGDASITLSKRRASLAFLVAAFNGSPWRDKKIQMEPIELAGATYRAVQHLGETPTRAQIDDAYAADGGILLRAGDWHLIHADYLCFLRGLSPELHEPAARVLAEAGADDILGWIDSIAVKTRWWPIDMKFDSGATRDRRFDRRDALPVVISADRCGILRDLLKWLADRDHRGRALLAIHDIVTERLFSFAASK